MQPPAGADILLRMLLLALLQACDSAVEGPHALAYDGSPDCATIDVSDAPPSSFTVEVWLRGDPDAFTAMRPMVLWKHVFNLSENADEQVVFVIGDEEVGASSPFTLMDGQLHHVAGTYDGTDGTARLFVDGALVGQSGTAAFVGDPDSRVQFGCAKEATEGFYGILDELRISSVVRYTDDFELPTGPYAKDDDTWMLFHLNEGSGATASSGAGDYEMVITDVAWVEFDLGTEE